MLTTSETSQLTLLLFLAVTLFIVASGLPKKIATITLIVLAPVQMIDTPFGDSSMVLAYVVFVALLLRGGHVRLPMLPHWLFLLVWYLISMSFMHPGTYAQHAVYVYTLVAAVLVFWLCYDLVSRVDVPATVLGAFIGANIIVAIYCLFQLWLGPGERFQLFGLSEMSLTRIRADGRLTGPFESAETTAFYFVVMTFLLVHQYWYTESLWRRRGIVLLGTLNLAFMVATGSRGEFILLLLGFAMYLWLFRRHLGPMRALGFAIYGSAAIVAAAMVIITLTQFGGLVDRLAATEVRAGIPDTRENLWPPTWNEIKKNPIIGHGPRFTFHNEHRGTRYEGHTYMEYPHNLYLFLLYTVGIPGLLLFTY